MHRWRHCIGVAAVAAATMLPGCRMLRSRAERDGQSERGAELSRQGVSAMELGAWDRAQLLLRKAAEAAPTDAESRRHLAEALWRGGHTEEAAQQALAGSDLDPYDSRLAVVAGEMLLATGDREGALASAERAIGVDPSNSQAWALRGRAFRKLGKSDRALADLQRALAYDGDDIGVLADLASLHQERGSPQRALTAVHQLLHSYTPGDEPAEALMMEGRAYLALGRAEMAVESLQAAVERGGPSAEGLCLLAEAHAAAGRPADALMAAQQALAADANHQATQALLARLGPAGDATLR